MVTNTEATVRSVRRAIAMCDDFRCELWVDVAHGFCALAYEQQPGSPPSSYCECWCKAQAAVGAMPVPPVVGNFG